MPDFQPPPANCPLCPRLVAFREDNARKFPHYYNGAVPPFGDADAELLVVGLAPGLKGANATGRPFTGDYAGVILYGALKKAGLARGEYDPERVASCQLPVASKDQPGTRNSKLATTDGFRLINTRITNAVRCVPPGNKPEPAEIRTCNAFLRQEIAHMPKLKVILSLGAVSHGAVLRALGLKLSQYKFAHGAQHEVSCELRVASSERKNNSQPGTRNSELTLLDSYHTSRYNINTGALTVAMFDEIIARVKALLRA
jgi:uracil-DNA glycosylase